MTFEEWLGLSYRNPSRVDRITLAKLFDQCVDMEPLDKSFDLTPFINTKQRVWEVVEEYFCHNNGVQQALVLDDDDLAMMENYLDLNPHDGFVRNLLHHVQKKVRVWMPRVRTQFDSKRDELSQDCDGDIVLLDEEPERDEDDFDNDVGCYFSSFYYPKFLRDDGARMKLKERMA
ncbi:hypothetical protein Tco_1292567 [Tanacetum coccineum]